MLAKGNVKVTDLLSAMPPAIPDGSHAMTQLVELPPADEGLAPHRHFGPVFGYVLEGRILFELEGVTRQLADEAMRLGAAKLPIKTRFVSRDEQFGE